MNATSREDNHFLLLDKDILLSILNLIDLHCAVERTCTSWHSASKYLFKILFKFKNCFFVIFITFNNYLFLDRECNREKATIIHQACAAARLGYLSMNKYYRGGKN